MNEFHFLVSTGSTLAIVPHRDQIVECLQMVRPTVIYSVPALFNKIHEGMLKAVDKQSVWTKRLFKNALKIARRRNASIELTGGASTWLELQHRFYDQLVLIKLREKLGGNIK